MGLVHISETSRWKKMLGFVGPGFLVSVAYLDPVETDLQAGANNEYKLLWIVLLGLSFALIIQSRSANLGVATGKHLSEHCRAEYPKFVSYCLWILAEASVIAADIPEVIGTAFALNILFNTPIWAGVLLAGLNTLLLLAIQRYGIRKLEVAISVLLLILGGCFFAVMAHTKPNTAKILRGMFIPKLSSGRAASDAVALLGALIMPHNLFLHSGLVLSRKIPHSFHAIKSACRFFLFESGVALFIAFLINVAVISVSGSVCSSHNLSSSNEARCKNITLNSAALLLKNVLGKWSSILYAVSLLASGQSSTVTGTYAGQFIMQGFLDMKMKPWLRNLLTRCIAIIPSLVASIISGPSGAARLIIIASMILSFQLPFALVPLLKFTSSEAKMGQHRNSRPITAVSWFLGLCMIGINMYFLGKSSLGWLMHRHLQVSSILALTIGFPTMMLYMGMLLYLTLKKETPVVTCSPHLAMDAVRSHQTQIEKDHNTASPTDQEQEIEIVCKEAQAPASKAHGIPLN